MTPLTVLPRYSPNGASSRLRFYAWRQTYEAAGFVPAYHPFFSPEYLQKLYAGKGKSRLAGIAALWRRSRIKLADALLIEYEFYPELPYCFDALALRGRRYVLDFDDNVWEKYASRPRLAGKFEALCRAASGVIAANDFLMEKIAPWQPNLIKIPTLIEPAACPVYSEMEKFPRFTLVWIGTPITYAFLEQQSGFLREAARKMDFELLVIAKKSLKDRAIPGVPMRFAEWSRETEGELLARSHVGLMPLDRSNFAMGKSAFKLIQYQAAGIPSIASPIGENKVVTTAGESGFFASTPAEWLEALTRLYTDCDRRCRMGAAARRRAEEHYSFSVYAPKLTDFLKKCLTA